MLREDFREIIRLFACLRAIVAVVWDCSDEHWLGSARLRGSYVLECRQVSCCSLFLFRVKSCTHGFVSYMHVFVTEFFYSLVVVVDGGSGIGFVA